MSIIYLLSSRVGTVKIGRTDVECIPSALTPLYIWTTCSITEAMSEEASNEPKKQRLAILDLVKGVAIIGVVILHLALLQGHGSEPVTDTGVGIMTFKPVLYSLLCTFIVISGYFYKPGKSFAENIKRRVVKLAIYMVIAMVALNSIMYGILCLQGYDLDISQLGDVIWQNIIGRGAFESLEDVAVYGGLILAPFEVTHQLYYLQMLLVGCIIFYAVVDKVIDDDRKLLATIFIMMTLSAVLVEYVGIVLPLYAHLGPMAAGFLLIGTFLSKKGFFQWLENSAFDRRYWCTFLILLIIALALCFITPRDVSILYCNFGPFGGWSLYSFVILSVAAGLMLSFVISWLRFIKILAIPIMAVGFYCISVHVLHMFVAKLIAAPFVTFNTEVWIPVGALAGVLLALITVTVIVLASLGLERLRKKKSIKRNLE